MQLPAARWAHSWMMLMVNSSSLSFFASSL